MKPDHRTPVSRADVLAHVTDDVLILRAKLAAGPWPGESNDRFVERMIGSVDRAFERWEDLALPVRVGRGRPRKTLFDFDTKARKPRGRPRIHDAEELVRLVDDWKKLLQEQGDRCSDAQALVGLLHRHAPPKIRREIDERLALHYRLAESKYAQRYALKQAVTDVEGPRFDRFVKLLSAARTKARRRD